MDDDGLTVLEVVDICGVDAGPATSSAHPNPTSLHPCQPLQTTRVNILLILLLVSSEEQTVLQGCRSDGISDL